MSILGSILGGLIFRKADEKTRQTAELAGNLIEEATKRKSSSEKFLNISNGTRKRVNKNLSAEKMGQYFRYIPMDLISRILSDKDLVVLNEDNTLLEFKMPDNMSGEGLISYHIGHRDSAVTVESKVCYTYFSNTALYVSWHKADNDRYEIVAYLS